MPTRILAAGEEQGHVLRAQTDVCGAGTNLVEVSFDSGASWQSFPVTDAQGVALQSIDAGNASILYATYLDSNCEPQFSRSFVGGTEWAPEIDLAGRWYIGAEQTFGAEQPPCTAVGFSSSGARGIVLCDDASVAVSEDAGTTWSAPIDVPNAAAVGLSVDGFVIASVDEDECTGAQTRLLQNGQLGDPGGCVEGSIEEGGVAVGGNATDLYLWAGDAFVRSTDGGATWS